MASGTWIFDGSDNWSNSARWSGGTVADGATFTANFTNNITATRTVTVDTVRTIGNITFSDAGGSGSAWVLSGANALTLDNGGAAPVLNVITGTTISGALAGTAGFTKAGAGALYLTNASSTNTISGTVTGSTDAGIYLNNTNSGVVNQLKDVGTFNFTSQFAFIAYLGSTGFTQNSAFTNSVSGYGRVISYNAGGITLNDASVGTFSGAFFAIGDATYTAPKIAFGVVPANAAAISLNSYASGATAVSTTATFAHTSASATTTPITIETATASATGHVAILEDNGTASTSFGGNVTKTGGASSSATLRLTGTNTSSTISGIVASSVGTLAVNKQGTGKWVLSGTNTYTGATTISASGGTLVAKSGGLTTGALGASSSTAAVTIASGTTLQLDGSAGDIVLTKTSSSMTLGGTGDGGLGAIYSSAGTNNSYTAAGFVLSALTRFRADASSKVTLTGVIDDGASTFGTEKTGTGEVALASANTYDGGTNIVAGTLSVATLAIGGSASGIGKSSNAAANLVIGSLGVAGTLKHTGAASTTDRNWTGGTGAGLGPTFDASGSGVLTMTSSSAPAYTASNTATTITLRGTSGNGTSTFNSFSQPVANNGTGAVSITKTDSGAWKFTNANANLGGFTGALTLSAGYLDLGNVARSLAAPIAVSSGTLQNSTNTVATSGGITMTGGTITAEIASTTAVTVNSGATARLEPQNTANTYTGATAINAGAVLEVVTNVDPEAPAAGKVLGNSAVTVAGTLTTSANANQRGQMRYGGNLTFNSGAILRIGFAA